MVRVAFQFCTGYSKKGYHCKLQSKKAALGSVELQDETFVLLSSFDGTSTWQASKSVRKVRGFFPCISCRRCCSLRRIKKDQNIIYTLTVKYAWSKHCMDSYSENLS